MATPDEPSVIPSPVFFAEMLKALQRDHRENAQINRELLSVLRDVRDELTMAREYRQARDRRRRERRAAKREVKDRRVTQRRA